MIILYSPDTKTADRCPQFHIRNDQLFFCDRSRRIFTNAVYAVPAGLHGLVSFTDTDDLSVLCLEAETDFTGLVIVDLELRILFLLESFCRLIFNRRDRRICDNGGDSVLAGLQRLVNFGSEDHFAVCGLQVKLDPGFGGADNKLSHCHIQLSPYMHFPCIHIFTCIIPKKCMSHA